MKQMDAASRLGANAILLIATLFRRKYCKGDLSEMIRYAHSKNLEVLLETHTYREFALAASSEADLIGINNRNLKTLKVDLNVTRKVLKKAKLNSKLVVSESGIEKPGDISFLHRSGAQAFLVGTSVMTAGNIEEKVRELVSSCEDC
ncbi:MAG: indole-3-glycerol-phosphate synthase, partial [Candidatus Bathyarchaeia archaeon]